MSHRGKFPKRPKYTGKGKTPKGYHPKTKKFGGSKFRLVGVFTTKTKAKKEANYRQKSGLKTRVFKTGKVKKVPTGAFGGTTKGRYTVYKKA